MFDDAMAEIGTELIFDNGYIVTMYPLRIKDDKALDFWVRNEYIDTILKPIEGVSNSEFLQTVFQKATDKMPSITWRYGEGFDLITQFRGCMRLLYAHCRVVSTPFDSWAFEVVRGLDTEGKVHLIRDVIETSLKLENNGFESVEEVIERGSVKQELKKK